MQLRVENGIPYVYAAHLHGKQVLKLRLDGTLVWALGVPMESGNTTMILVPTTRLPLQLHLMVASTWRMGMAATGSMSSDLTWCTEVHSVVEARSRGRFQTCHGLYMDERGSEPMLVVCDRENRRLQRFDLDGKHVDVPVEGLRRPCALAAWSGDGRHLYAVAELEGRVTLLDGEWNVLGHLGDNPDTSQWARNGVPAGDWTEGIFTAPHGCCFDEGGNLYVMDWNAVGRMTKMRRTPR